MSTVEPRCQIKEAVNQLLRERLESLVDYVHFLNRPSIVVRLKDAEKAIGSGKGVN